MKSARDKFLDIIKANRNGFGTGIYSVCSANPYVLESCFEQAKTDGSIILLESTSNQVNQFGGYTGMTPADFAAYTAKIAAKVGFPKEMILLGGDHLGPNPWKNLPANEAMEKAKVLIAEYVKAGFLKIHLDTSMICADDNGDKKKPLTDQVVAARTAILCKVAEKTWQKFRKGCQRPVYVIGTEVPVPGGSQEKEVEVVPTMPEDAEKTVITTREHFIKAGLSGAWDRVIATVVQPGVEFGDDQVFHYKPENTKWLNKKIMEFAPMVFEAHSTDYQTEENLKALVKDHFCILKVGPWLTFAYREALFAMEAMEIELLGKSHGNLSNLGETLKKQMLIEPKYWKNYYHGNEKEQAFKQKYSFSDRSRYYWPMADVELSRKKLFANLLRNRIPSSLLSQFMPAQFYQVCNGSIGTSPDELVKSHIRTVAGIYSRACGFS